MRTVAQYLSIAALLLGVVAPTSIDAQDSPTVSVQDDAFVPSRVEFTAGTTLTWTLEGAEQHTITADDGSFDSGIVNPGGTFVHVFDTAATIPYYCQIHGAPGGIGMAGVIVVG